MFPSIRSLASKQNKLIKSQFVIFSSQSIFTQTQVHKTVADAIRVGKPVVALESTIISHGLPYPQNLEMAQAVEKIISK